MDALPVYRGEQRAERKNETLYLPVDVYPYSHPLSGHAGEIISRLVWERLGVPSDKLEEVVWEREV